MITIGDRLKALRESKSLSQKGLGDAIGLAFSSISAIENGRSSPPESLRKIADYFKVEYEWLLNGDGPTPDGVVVPIRKELAESPWKDALYQQMREEIIFLRETVADLRKTAAKANFLNASTVAGGHDAIVVAMPTANVAAGAQVGARA